MGCVKAARVRGARPPLAPRAHTPTRPHALAPARLARRPSPQVMEPGHVLYIPAGFPHETDTLTDTLT
eukprot:2701899-Prymnesium_polylepis.1